jgi:hypothetical protein
MESDPREGTGARAGVNQAMILICTIAALIIAILALCKQEGNRPFYFKIEVQYGR